MSMRALCLLALGAAACAGLHERPASAERPSAPAHVVADASFALALSAALARGAWEDWVPGSIPFAIVYPGEQWVFRASAPLPGYEPQPFTSALGPAFRAASWTRYDGVRVPFSPPRFFAQADRFDDSVTFTIAAPSLAPFPASDWATVFAHEYFHTFQMTDARWTEDAPSVAPARRRTLAALYQSDTSIRASVSRELELYAARIGAVAPVACDALGDVAEVRRLRRAALAAIDPGLPEVERALERFEGTARYVEERAYELGEVADAFRTREPAWEPTPAPESLRRRLGVNAGEYYYATGYALARILDACNPRWKASLRGRDLLELAQRQ